MATTDDIDYSDIEAKCVVSSLLTVQSNTCTSDTRFNMMTVSTTCWLSTASPSSTNQNSRNCLQKSAKSSQEKGFQLSPTTFSCLGATPLAKVKGTVHVLHFSARLIFFPTRFIFVEFRNSDDANLALAAMDNHPFDAKHQFKVNRFTDIERYEKLDETYVEPETEEYTPRVSISSHAPGPPFEFHSLFPGTSPRMARRPPGSRPIRHLSWGGR